MSQLFGPHRRNRRIRNAFLVVGIPAVILVAYFGFIKNDGNSNTIIVSEEEVNEEAIKYINRLSDLFFVLSRVENNNGKKDILWKPGKNV